MHASLSVSINLTTQALAGGAVAVALLALDPLHPEICVLSLALGALAGWLQAQAIRQSADGLGAASSAQAVRRLLKASPPGLLSIRLSWLNALILLALFIAGLANFDSALAAYAVFLLARELSCLPAVRALNNSPP